MVLVECPECGKRISDKALSCPDCGYPTAQPPAQLIPKEKTSLNDIFDGVIEFPTTVTSLQLVTDSTAASGVQADPDELHWAVASIEEGEKRRLDSISVGIGWDSETNFPKATFNIHRTPTKKIVRWIKGKGRR